MISHSFGIESVVAMCYVSAWYLSVPFSWL